MDVNSKRNLTVLAVVVTCFAILWPKIFYPMILSIIFPVSTDEDLQEDMPKINTDNVLRPHMREAMGEARPLEKSTKEGNKVLFHPSVRYMAKTHSKGAGAVNLVIPVYTIGIILFFIYSLLKTVFKPQHDASYKNDASKILSPVSSSESEDIIIRRKDQERKTQHALKQYGKDKVLSALKTIILEMEDFKGNLFGKDTQENVLSEIEKMQDF